jgi:hypothetical protein
LGVSLAEIGRQAFEFGVKDAYRQPLSVSGVAQVIKLKRKERMSGVEAAKDALNTYICAAEKVFGISEQRWLRQYD